jgi:pre-mRNA-splicing helicase BRR2
MLITVTFSCCALSCCSYQQCTTVELFASSVTAKTKLRGLLDILASAAEYNVLPLRHRESKVLEVLARKLPQALPSDWEWDSTPTKAHILLQAHCTRTALPVDLREDQRIAVAEAPRLLSAAVDVISSCGWLRPALEAMELTQMIVQACWGRDSYLKQVWCIHICIHRSDSVALHIRTTIAHTSR